MSRSGETRRRVRRPLTIEMLEDRRVLSFGGLFSSLTSVLPPPPSPVLAPLAITLETQVLADLSNGGLDLSANLGVAVGDLEVTQGLQAELSVGGEGLAVVEIQTQVEVPMVGDLGLGVSAGVAGDSLLAIETELQLDTTLADAALTLGVQADPVDSGFGLGVEAVVAANVADVVVIAQEVQAGVTLDEGGLIAVVETGTRLDTPLADVGLEAGFETGADESGIQFGIGVGGSIGAGDAAVEPVIEMGAGIGDGGISAPIEAGLAIGVDGSPTVNVVAQVGPSPTSVRFEISPDLVDVPPSGEEPTRNDETSRPTLPQEPGLLDTRRRESSSTSAGNSSGVLIGGDDGGDTAADGEDSAEPASPTAEELSSLLLSTIVIDFSTLSVGDPAWILPDMDLSGAGVASVAGDVYEATYDGALDLEGVLLRASDLLAGLLPFDVAALGSLLSYGNVGRQVLDFLAELGWAPWLMAAAVALAGHEVARRRKQREGEQGDEAAMLSWLAARPAPA